MPDRVHVSSHSVELGVTRDWFPMGGVIFGALTLVFLMALVGAAVLGHQIPCDSRFLVSAVVGFGAALSSAFLGGDAAAKGQIPIPGVARRPFTFSLAGGIAVLVIVMLVGQRLIPSTCGSSGEIAITCPTNYQSYQAEKLLLAFCYPRSNWELDKSALESNAADVFIRYVHNRDVSIHLHVSNMPPDYVAKHREFVDATVRTWKQLDPRISLVPDFYAGREAYRFSMSVRDRENRSRPTDVMTVFMTDEKLLDVFSTSFEDTNEEVRSAMRRIASTVVFAR